VAIAKKRKPEVDKIYRLMVLLCASACEALILKIQLDFKPTPQIDQILIPTKAPILMYAFLMILFHVDASSFKNTFYNSPVLQGGEL
jgi:hypothetical protein